MRLRGCLAIAVSLLCAAGAARARTIVVNDHDTGVAVEVGDVVEWHVTFGGPHHGRRFLPRSASDLDVPTDAIALQWIEDRPPLDADEHEEPVLPGRLERGERVFVFWIIKELSATNEVRVVGRRPGGKKDEPNPCAGTYCLGFVGREPVWPRGRAAFLLAASGGYCARHDPTLGSVGFCSEGALGIIVPFRAGSTSWHFTAETGIGQTPVTAAPTAGQERISGGAYLAARVLLGADFTRRLFSRLGVQVLAHWATVDGDVVPGVQGLFDLGARLGDQLEIGARVAAGTEGVTTVVGHPTWSGAFAFGASLLLRFVPRPGSARR